MASDANIAAACAVRLTLRFPFWAEVFYSMTIKEADADKAQIDTAGTDGRTLWINPKFWGKLNLDEQVGLLCHELGHKIMLHCTRRGARDAMLWNIACDHVINNLLTDNAIVLPKGGCCDPKYKGMISEAVYNDLLQQQKAGKKFAYGPGGQDIVEPTGTVEEIAKLEADIQAVVERAVANAKAYGNLPRGMYQGVIAAHKPKREAWYNALHRYMQSLASSEYNWARLNRRTLKSHGVFTPLHLSEALGDIAVFIDASGSVYRGAAQANFAGHLNAILAEARPHRVHQYYFDAQVYPGEVLEAGTLDFTSRPRGGGGTAFEPIFQQLEDDGIVPEVCIILTDLEGSFPSSAPEYPVVWASIEDHPAPFGEVMVIES